MPSSLCVSFKAIPTASQGMQREGFFLCLRSRCGSVTKERNTKMKAQKLLIICSVGIVGGCATTTQMDNANIQIGGLESRLARIERDLYRVELKSAPKQIAEPKFVPATEVSQNVIDTKIDAFLKEYLGAQFGDSIDLYPTPINDSDWDKGRLRYIQVKKPFGYLDKAIGQFTDGKLYSISFVADIDRKYSEDSTNERINQTLADLAVTLGLASDAFSKGLRGALLGLRGRRSGNDACSSYDLFSYNGEITIEGFRRRGAVIENSKLRRKIENEAAARRRAAGEVLPEKKIGGESGNK